MLGFAGSAPTRSPTYRVKEEVKQKKEKNGRCDLINQQVAEHYHMAQCAPLIGALPSAPYAGSQAQRQPTVAQATLADQSAGCGTLSYGAMRSAYCRLTG
jgi:hypothetical protein